MKTIFAAFIQFVFNSLVIVYAKPIFRLNSCFRCKYCGFNSGVLAHHFWNFLSKLLIANSNYGKLSIYSVLLAYLVVVLGFSNTLHAETTVSSTHVFAHEVAKVLPNLHSSY